MWPLGSGEWAFSLDEVRGSGAEAAGVSAAVRYTLRGIATAGADPAALLVRLNEVLLAGTGEKNERLCTTVFGLIRPSGAGFEVGGIWRDAPAGANEAVVWLENTVLGWSGGRLGDDLAVLVLQVRG